MGHSIRKRNTNAWYALGGLWLDSFPHSTQHYMIYCTYKTSLLWREIRVVPKKEFVLFRGRIRGVEIHGELAK
jgi:hypothetical protein